MADRPSPSRQRAEGIEYPLRVDLSKGPKTGTFCEQPGVLSHPRRLLGQVNGDADLDPTKPQPDQQEDDGERHRSLLCLAGRGQSPAGEHTLKPRTLVSKPCALPIERMPSLARHLLRPCTGAQEGTGHV